MRRCGGDNLSGERWMSNLLLDVTASVGQPWVVGLPIEGPLKMIVH